MEPDYENVIYEVREPLAWITVNRPAKLNALNGATVRELAAAAGRAIESPEVRVIVVTGAGEKAFVAGADIAEMAAMDPADAQRFSAFLQASLGRLERSPKPVLAAINGFALGGGCELALACHIRIAAQRAKLGQPEVGLGLIPGAGGTQRLPRVVGRGRALELILSGATIDAQEAWRIGLVNRVVEDDQLNDTVEKLGARLAAQSPIAQERAIEAVLAAGEVAQDEALRLEAGLFGLGFATEDMKEGTRAFVEKRKANFRGR